MASSGANINDILASSSPVRDIGEGQHVKRTISRRVHLRLAVPALALAVALAFALPSGLRAGQATVNPPTVVTGTATSITAAGATLNGTVNPNGSSTTALFQYGLTTSYGGQVTVSPAPGSGTSPVAVSAAIAGLVCDRSYHFRAVATNPGGTTNGADKTFTTGACPTVVTGTATSITAAGATLNGTVNPNGGSTTALFQYGLTTSYGGQVTVSPAPGSGTSPVAVSAAIAGLVCDRSVPLPSGGDQPRRDDERRG